MRRLLGYEPVLTCYALSSAFVAAAVWATAYISDHYSIQWLTLPVILAIWYFALWNVRLLTKRVSSHRAEINDSWLVEAVDHELIMEIPPEPEERHLFYKGLIARSPRELMKENGVHYHGFSGFNGFFE